MLPHLLVLQLAALCATVSAVIPVNVLTGEEVKKHLRERDEEKEATPCWTPEKVEQSRQNEEKYWEDQSRLYKDPRWSTVAAHMMDIESTRTTKLLRQEWSSFDSLKSSLMLEYHSTNPFYWTRTQSRKSDEFDCEGPRRRPPMTDPSDRHVSDAQPTDRTMTSDGNGSPVSSTTTSDASSPSEATNPSAVDNAGVSNGISVAGIAVVLVAGALL